MATKRNTFLTKGEAEKEAKRMRPLFPDHRFVVEAHTATVYTVAPKLSPKALEAHYQRRIDRAILALQRRLFKGR